MSYTPTSTIKTWAAEDRPREKLVLKGKASLSNAELMAILIGSGSKNESAVELSKKILSNSNNSLQELSRLNIDELSKFKGIGPAKAITIIAAIELGKRYRSSDALQKKKITCSRDAFDTIFSSLTDINYEEFYIILLNRANEVLSIQKVSEGGVSGTVVDAKKIFKIVIDKKASSIILAHNHPSGNTNPSPEDKALTEKIVSSGKILDVNVLDHIIIGNGKYYSFADEGIL